MRFIKSALTSEILYVLVALSASAYLGFRGLGNHSFWDDEAQVAIFAKNLMRTGDLSGWDGRNLFTYRNGSLLDSNLRPINSPMHYYVAAVSFKIFGISTWAARFPCVVFGMAALVAFWFLLKLDFPENRPLRLYALFLVALSYSFLLNIRQGTYYAPALCFSLSSCYLFKRGIRDKRMGWFLALGLSLALLFLAHFLLCAALMGGMTLVFLCFYSRKQTISRFCNIGLSAVIFAAVAAPYAVHFEIWKRHELPEDISRLAKTAILFYYNLRELDLIGYLPGIFISAAIICSAVFKKHVFLPRVVFEWCILILGYLLALSFLSIQPPMWLGWSGFLADIRYMLVLMPFTAGITACFLAQLHRIRFGPWLGAALAATMLCTNILSFNVAKPGFRWLLPAFILEIHNDFVTPYDAVIAFLSKNAKKDEIVYAYPEHHLNAIQAHLGDALRMQGLLRPNTLLPKEKLAGLNGLKFINDAFPDWIVIFGLHADVQSVFNYFVSASHTYSCSPSDGECPNAKLDVYYDDMTRPELPWHRFGPVLHFDPDRDVIYVHKKMKKR